MTIRNLIKRTLIVTLRPSIYYKLNAAIAAESIRLEKRFEAEIEILERFVKAGDRVIDVGANHGLYAYHLGRLVGCNGEVHCFEPMPPNLQVLSEVIKKLKLTNVRVHSLGCSDQNEQKMFHIPEVDGLPYYGLAYLGGNEKQVLSAEVVRLDDVIEGPIKFIKCDVEGAESHVLRGASRIVHESQPTVLVEVETEAEWTERLNYTPQQVWTDLFQPLGYKIYRLINEQMQEEEEFKESGNYFLVPEDLVHHSK